MLFTEHPLSERVAAARKAGFDAVEVQFPYELTCEQWLQLLGENSVKMTLINLPAGDLMSGGEGLAAVPKRKAEFEEALQLGLKYAEALQVDAVNTLPGVCHDTNNRTLYRTTLLNNLSRAASQLEKIGVRATVEAINKHDMPGFIVSSLAEMQQILTDVNHRNLFMQYDCYHMARMNEPLLEQLPRVIEQVGHIQFADCPGRGQPSSGQLDYPAIFRLIRELNYPYWLGAEYRPHNCDSNASLNWLQELKTLACQ